MIDQGLQLICDSVDVIRIVSIERRIDPDLPPIGSSSLEEEERLELDYADDPPVPCVEGTAQGTRVLSPCD